MVTKQVHYRKFDAPKANVWSGQTLHSLIRQSLEQNIPGGLTYGTSFKARTFDFPLDNQFRCLIHNIRYSADVSFGSLCLFSPDLWAAVLRRSQGGTPDSDISLEETLAELEVAERPPVKGEDFLRGISYWLVVGNHLFTIQHVSLQTKAYELYFQQLFAKAGLIGINDRFGLTSVFDRTIVGGDLGDITSVEIGGVVPRAPDFIFADDGSNAASQAIPTVNPIVTQTSAQKHLVSGRVSRFDKAAEILRTIFGTISADRIMSAVPEEAELEVDVRFGYRTKRRSVNRAALAEIATAARNLPDGEVRALGKDGKQIGNDLRLSVPMPFTPVRERSSLLELDNTYAQMFRVYSRFVEDGKIEP